MEARRWNEVQTAINKLSGDKEEVVFVPFELIEECEIFTNPGMEVLLWLYGNYTHVPVYTQDGNKTEMVATSWKKDEWESFNGKEYYNEVGLYNKDGEIKWTEVANYSTPNNGGGFYISKRVNEYLNELFKQEENL